jgi:hypothetical protein
VYRRSTSSGLARSDTGATLPGSGGRHLYVLVADGSDIERALRDLHSRCWIAGYGWHGIGKAGQLLDRCIIDPMVYGPERLVFEGPPRLDPPLVQDLERRRPRVREGAPLDTKIAIPPLDPNEKLQLARLKDAAARALAGECAKLRATYIRARAEKLEQAGATPAAAKAAAEKLCGGVLLPAVELPFDDSVLAGKTVGDVLADPDAFGGETLADPIEGVEYGVNKAKILRRPDGSLIVHSFAHGGAIYELKQDADSLRAALAKVADGEAITAFVRLRRMAELDDVEPSRIRQELIARLKIGARAFNAQEKVAREERRQRQEQNDREREAAGDTRPRVAVPLPDAPQLVVLPILDSMLGVSAAIEPPMRDPMGWMVAAVQRKPWGLHVLGAGGAKGKPLPPPEQVLITHLMNTRSAA